MAERQINSQPLAYFITFHTFGTWLHGEDVGSVDDQHNRPGTSFAPPSQLRKRFERNRMKQNAVTLDRSQRRVIDGTIREVCDHRGWCVHALNVRSTHVHVVVQGASTPERMMNDFKSWGTRRLKEAGLIAEGIKVWTRHGSTRYLWDERSVCAASDYTLNRQGGTQAKDDPSEPRL